MDKMNRINRMGEEGLTRMARIIGNYWCEPQRRRDAEWQSRNQRKWKIEDVKKTRG
jgi:hypothetical protein